MSEIPVNEQWKLDADCHKCRRQPYCSKLCTQSTRLAKQHLRELWEKALQKRVQQLKDEQEKKDTESAEPSDAE